MFETIVSKAWPSSSVFLIRKIISNEVTIKWILKICLLSKLACQTLYVYILLINLMDIPRIYCVSWAIKPRTWDRPAYNVSEHKKIKFY